MTPSAFIKPIPSSVAIFGASGHIGGPMARFLRFHAPHIRLRLISSSADKLGELRQQHPGAEVVLANYFDQSSLDAAMVGIQGVFVITTSLLDERPAMSNLVAALRKSGALIHMIRITGIQPDTNPKRIPKALRDFGLGLEIQHPIARQILDDADMPVTYLNCGASFMDNYLRMAGMIHEGLLCWHDRRVPYLDPREIGEAAARLLLSDDSRHVGQFYTLNNGESGLRPSEVAQMLSGMLGRTIAHDGSREGLFRFFQPLIDAGLAPASVPEYLWNFFEYENANEHVWVPNKFLETLLGRKPNTLRAWLMEHLHHFGDVTRPALIREAPTAGAASIDGVWDCTVATPMGKEPNELTVRSTPDGRLEGEMKSVRTGTSLPLQDGKFNGNVFTWTMQMLEPIKLTLKVEVQVNGNQLAGHAKAGMMGKTAIEGIRRA